MVENGLTYRGKTAALSRLRTIPFQNAASETRLAA